VVIVTTVAQIAFQYESKFYPVLSDSGLSKTNMKYPPKSTLIKNIIKSNVFGLFYTRLLTANKVVALVPLIEHTL
jgi:hypothetical protein